MHAQFVLARDMRDWATSGNFEALRATARELAGACVARLLEIGGGAARVVDKMMTNFLHLGFIALLVPQAKIIHTVQYTSVNGFQPVTNIRESS